MKKNKKLLVPFFILASCVHADVRYGQNVINAPLQGILGDWDYNGPNINMRPTTQSPEPYNLITNATDQTLMHYVNYVIQNVYGDMSAKILPNNGWHKSWFGFGHLYNDDEDHYAVYLNRRGANGHGITDYTCHVYNGYESCWDY